MPSHRAVADTIRAHTPTGVKVLHNSRVAVICGCGVEVTTRSRDTDLPWRGSVTALSDHVADVITNLEPKGGTP